MPMYTLVVTDILPPIASTWFFVINKPMPLALGGDYCFVHPEHFIPVLVQIYFHPVVTHF